MIKMLKFGIVGAGIIGVNHQRAIEKNENCELVAICDTVLERAINLAKENPNIQCFTDYKEMCEKVQMDAVVLNLPHFLHREVSVYFLEKGINVLVEKPMAMTKDECDAMINSSLKSGAKLAVGHVQRYLPIHNEIKKIIESKALGKLCMITEMRNIDYLSPNRPGWFLKKKLSGGGIVMNYGAHTLDKIMYMTGEKVVEASSYLSNPLSDDDVEINAQILFKFTGDITAAVSYCGCHIPRTEAVSFFFTNGEIKVEYNKPVRMYINGELFEPEKSSVNSFDAQIEEFVKLINNETSFIATAQYGKEIISVLEKILK